MDDQFARNEQERERYYGERYEAVLEELRQVRGDYDTIIKNQERHDKRFDEMDKRFGEMDNRFGEMDKGIEAVKAASETAHEEILSRLERIESRLD